MLTFPGPVVTLRSFAQSAPRKLRKISSVEYEAAVTSLMPNFGTVVRTRLPRQPKKSVFFIKKKPEQINDWQSAIYTLERYSERFNCPLHSSATNAMKTMLMNHGHVPKIYFAYRCMCTFTNIVFMVLLLTSDY